MAAEKRGAKFEHHDGGQQEATSLLPGLVSRADVIFSRWNLSATNLLYGSNDNVSKPASLRSLFRAPGLAVF